MIKLNLLSNKQQNAIKLKAIYYYVENVVGLAIVMLTAVTIFIVPLSNGLKSVDEILQLKRQSNELSSTGLNGKIALLNSKIASFSEVTSKHYQWTDLLDKLSASLPTGTYVSGFEADITTGKFTIKGFAPTRDDYLKFKDNLVSSENFYELETPLTDILNRKNLTFTISGKFK